MELSKEAMKCAFEMELEAAISSTTQSKGVVIYRYLRAAYDAGARGDAIKAGQYDEALNPAPVY